MSKNDIEPAGAQPIWPLGPRNAGDLALPARAGQSSYTAGAGATDINLATLWRIIVEWRWLIIGATAIAVMAAIVFTFLTTPLYRATATLEINPPAVEILDPQKTGGRMTTGGNDPAFLATQYGLLGSRNLAQRVAQELNLSANPLFVPEGVDRRASLKIATGRLMSNFSVEPVVGSRLVRISYVSPSPAIAARVANSYADNFINSNLERRYQSSSYARQFLERQISRLKVELEKSERQLVAYAQANGLISLGGGGDSAQSASDTGSLEGSSLVALNAALAQAQTRRVTAEQRYRQATQLNAAQVNQATASLRSARAAIEAEYQEKLQTYKPDYPDMVRLRSKITALNEQIQQEAATVSGGQAVGLLAEYRAAAAEERNLIQRVNQLKSAVLDERGDRIQYTILQREVDTNRSLYDALLQRYKEIGVAGGIGTSSVSVVDRAEQPGGAYSPNLLFNLAVGLALGLIAGVGAALALEFLNDTIKTPDDVRQKLGLPSLGVIPKKKGVAAVATELEDQSSPISEAYSSLRTSLQFTSETGAPKSLLVTSSRAAEGKSSTTLALAQGFARLGRSVLLIDSDLRKPAFVTETGPDVGLSRLLTNTDPIVNHISRTQIENLSILPCGPIPPNPAELLASQRLRAVIAEASAAYDMVVIDGPPVLGLADAPLLSGTCQATLMVIESGKTRTRAALDATNRLSAAGANIVGAALTKFRHQSHGYGYGYGYEPYKYGGVGTREREIKLIARRAD